MSLNNDETRHLLVQVRWGIDAINNIQRGTCSKYIYNKFVDNDGINIKCVQFEGCAFWGRTMPQNDEDED